jgi:hypothetical protein
MSRRGRPHKHYRVGDLVRLRGVVGIYVGPSLHSWGLEVRLDVETSPGHYTRKTLACPNWREVELLDPAQMTIQF